jgi:glycosyltransferase involved in cell wall biosynthesis
MTPSISIVIPVRNQAPRLRLTLAALERQEGVSPGTYEVIVVDDDSSDDVEAVVEAERGSAPYALKKVLAKSHGARGLPRNIGCAEARGDLILLLDADALPGRRLVARHSDAQTSQPGVVLGDMYVLPGTELLLNPADGTPFPGVRPEAPLILPTDDVRRGVDDQFLLKHAQKGGYPGQAAWHLQLEEMLREGEAPFAWLGAIPHNLSIPRKAFHRLGGFDTSLKHAEGWDFGIRTRRAGYAIGWAEGALSFHLFHQRTKAFMDNNFDQARDTLLERYPDSHLDLVDLWINATQGNKYLPEELELGNWRSVKRILSNPTLLAECQWLRREWMRVRWPLTALEYRTHAALNRPFSRVLG